MNQKTYHHGDLKRALIETGIEVVNQEGADHFSLRKVAAKCGVSNAAPYAHFKSKEELLSAMKDYVTQEFVNVLQDTLQKYPLDRDMITHMGKSYVMFFIQNPHYFPFIFSHPDITVDLTPGAEVEKNYPPFALFQKTVLQVMGKPGIPAEKINDVTIAMWAMVHGMASIAVMKNVRLEDKWEEKIEIILKSMSTLYHCQRDSTRTQ